MAGRVASLGVPSAGSGHHAITALPGGVDNRPRGGPQSATRSTIAPRTCRCGVGCGCAELPWCSRCCPTAARSASPQPGVGQGGGEDPAAPVVAAADLLRLLRVISRVPATAGNHAQQAARQSPGKEDDRTACTTQSAAGPIPAPPSQLASQLPALAHCASRGRDRGTPDHPGGATRIADRARNASSGAAGPAQLSGPRSSPSPPTCPRCGPRRRPPTATARNSADSRG